MRSKRIISAVFVLGLSFGFGNSNAFGMLTANPGDGATDAEHLAYGAQSVFGASGFLKISQPGGGFVLASGTLVSPQWFLTSADVTLQPPNYDNGLPLSQLHVGFDADSNSATTTYSVTQIIRPPGFDVNHFLSDMAFLKLNTPVTDITPAQIYTGPLVTGQEVSTIGYGVPGTPATGLLPSDGKRRGMVNQIVDDQIFRNFWALSGPFVETQFEPDKLASDYEYLGGAGTAGDDGAGLMVLDNGTWKLAGIDSFGFSNGNYLDNDVYTPLSAYTNWISSQPALAGIVPEPMGISSVMMIGTVGLLKRRSRKN